MRCKNLKEWTLQIFTKEMFHYIIRKVNNHGITSVFSSQWVMVVLLMKQIWTNRKNKHCHTITDCATCWHCNFLTRKYFEKTFKFLYFLFVLSLLCWFELDLFLLISKITKFRSSSNWSFLVFLKNYRIHFIILNNYCFCGFNTDFADGVLWWYCWLQGRFS